MVNWTNLNKSVREANCMFCKVTNLRRNDKHSCWFATKRLQTGKVSLQCAPLISLYKTRIGNKHPVAYWRLSDYTTSLRRTLHLMVAGLTAGGSGRRIFFSRIGFLCWLHHSRVAAMASPEVTFCGLRDFKIRELLQWHVKDPWNSAKVEIFCAWSDVRHER